MFNVLCVDVGVGGVGFDEGAAGRHVVTHEEGEDAVGAGGVLDGHLAELASFGVHGGVAQLVAVHFTQTFVALHVDALVAELEECALAVVLGPAVDLLVAFLDEVERGSGEVDVAVLDELGHIAEEEGEHEGVDMCAVDIGIGHDDDLVVAELAEVEGLGVLGGAHGDAEGGVDVADGFALEGAVAHHFLDIEDFTAEGQDGLEAAVAALLGGATCGVTLDEEDLAFGGVVALAVGQFAGHAGGGEDVAALHHLAGLAGGLAGAGGEDDLVDDGVGLGGMLLEVVFEHLADGLVDGAAHLGVAELGLGLALELGFGDLDGDDGGETLAEVVAGNLYLGFLQQTATVGIVLQRAGETAAEAGEVGAALVGVDVVHVGVEVLAVAGVVLHGDLDGDAFALALDVDGVGHELLTVLVEVGDEVAQALLAVEVVGAHGCDAVLLHLAQVGDVDGDAFVQVCQLAHTLQQRVVLVLGYGEDGGVGVEGDFGAPLVGDADFLDGVEGFALGVFLLVDFAVAVDVDDHVVAEGVDAGDADAVEAAGDLVGVFVEFAAGVEDGHDDLEGGAVLFLVHVDGDTATVVLDGDAVVGVYLHVDLVAVARQSLVNGVVHNLIDKVVQAAFVHVADVHGRAHAHGFQSFKYGNVTRTVVNILIFAHIVYLLFSN